MAKLSLNPGLCDLSPSVALKNKPLSVWVAARAWRLWPRGNTLKGSCCQQFKDMPSFPFITNCQLVIKFWVVFLWPEGLCRALQTFFYPSSPLRRKGLDLQGNWLLGGECGEGVGVVFFSLSSLGWGEPNWVFVCECVWGAVCSLLNRGGAGTILPAVTAPGTRPPLCASDSPRRLRPSVWSGLPTDFHTAVLRQCHLGI